MADAEEPQFTSLSARIAALNQSQSAQSTTFGKRPPPPIPTSSNRPAIQPRVQTTNNPPLTTYGSSVTKQANNQPIGVKGNLLPPPPVDRDNPQNVRTSPLPARSLPPPLPGRKGSQVSPALPPRRPSTQLVRRGSDASIQSISSTVSGMSLGHVSSITSTSSVDTQVGRNMPPPLDRAKLPPLPPSRKEKDDVLKTNRAQMGMARFNSSNALRETPAAEHESAPKMPPRPSGPPRMPSRPASSNVNANEASSVQPPRRLPPPANTTRNILSMGFNNKSKPVERTDTPNVPARPIQTTNTSSALAVQELTEHNFDSIVMSGKPTFVDFYAPYCKWCKELDPVWLELAQAFAFASDRLVIAKLDINEHKSFLERFDIPGYPTLMYFDGKNETPEKYPYMRDLPALTEYLEKKTGISAASATRPSIPPPINMSTKPMINMSTKPSVNRLQVSESRSSPAPDPAFVCMLCRDFSGPDGVATQYPRHSLPSGGDLTGYLAEVLCGPFRSYTDKARAIFTWLHHNVAYDTVAFFNKNVKHMEPKDVIHSGLAVCGGYAGLYVAIALKAGLECVMVTGHGKGFGHTPLKPGERPPPCKPDGHAWNAVRIDGGEWKLLDACWGAGNVTTEQVYIKQFTPRFFTMTNDEFGLSHFPADDRYFFRGDGGLMTWDTYIIGPIKPEPLQTYMSLDEHGISPSSYSPPQKKISVNSGEVIRFQFSLICEHWDPVKHGKGVPYQMILKINGRDGRKEDYVAFEKNEFWWWCDVHASDLGAPGQKLSCFAVTSINGQDARGLTRKDYLSKKGKVGMGFGGVCAWDLI